MCTLSIIPSATGYVLTMNRDERRQRQEAGLYSGKKQDLVFSYPVDASAGGTWVAVNSRGVAMALLNRYQAPVIDRAVSRGKIIANAIELGELSAVLAYFKQLDIHQYNPFDCLLLDHSALYHISWDRSHYHRQSLQLTDSLVFTSSAERLDEVQQFRSAQFTRWREAHDDAGHIDIFHLQHTPQLAHNSVLMSRPHSHTKSIVQIAVDDKHCRLDYYTRENLQPNTRLFKHPPTQSSRMSLLHLPPH